jgi:hypothetical protein
MPRDMINLPLIGRAAEAVPGSLNRDERTIDIVWTTGATVQRRRWEGWDDLVEYDEELVVSPNAVRMDRLNSGAPFLNSHNAWSLESVLGSVVPGSARIQGGNGYATIRLTEAADVAAAVAKIMDGSVKFVSVGYRVHQYEITRKDGERELWRAVDWEPMEISAVAMPADPGAQIRSADGRQDALNICVVTRADASAAAAANPRGTTMPNDNPAGGVEPVTRTAPPAPQNPAPAPAPVPAVPNAEEVRTAERTRTTEIMALVQRHGLGNEMATDLIARGVTLDEARTAVLDRLAERSAAAGPVAAAPTNAAGQAGEVAYRDAVVNALRHRHNPGAVTLETGAREFRGLSLLEMARAVLERHGVQTRGLSRMELAGLAFETRSAGYHSTSDFTAILANVANNTLRAAYDSTPRTFAAFCRRAVITDFKPVQRSQLGGAPDLLKVNEAGEFKYGSIAEGKENYALATYGRIMAITRQVLINDDLDAFTRVPAAFGASAADLESDMVYAILTSNPAMGDGTALFHANHGNLLTASIIDETNLAAAYRAFANQKGLEKRPISIMPRYIIVPPGVRAVQARKQVTATTPAAAADVNTFAGRMEVVEEPRLIPASGNDPWFLSADPARIDTIEYAYLDGQEGVFTETRMGFNVDGMEIKARHDFATKAIDWRGMSKNPGL